MILASTSSGTARTMSVSTVPGARAFTRIPRVPNSAPIDRVKDKLQNAVVVMGSVENGKVRLAAGVTKNNIDKVRAGELINFVAEQ